MAYLGKTPSQAVRSRYFYTATGGETSLSGADNNGDTLIFADGNYVDVYLNGVLLVAGTDYNVNTTNTIAGLVALTASDIVEIVVYDTFSVFGGTFQGTLTANSIKLGSSTTVSSVLDEDTMTSDSATALATQQSIKAYVDTQVATVPVGDITEVTAGTGLTGGGASGAVTLNVVGGTGITANADDIAIDATVATLTGTQTLTNKTLGATSVTADISFGDNDKAIFGAGSDLQIYHNGLNSYVEDAGTGALILRGNANVTIGKYTGETMGFFEADGSVYLYHDNSVKLTTTATGVDVTGAISTNKGSAGVLATISDGVNSNFVVETSSLLTTIGQGGGSAALALKANNTEAMRIDNSGNVGIGTTSPTFLTGSGLEVSRSGTATVRVERTDATASAGEFFAGNDKVVLGTATNTHLQFRTNNVEAMRIDTSGNVGIGTSFPSTDISKFGGSAKGLSVAAGQPVIAVRATANAQYVGYFGQASTNTYLGALGGGSLVIQTGTSGTERLRIDNSGAVRINTTTNVVGGGEYLSVSGGSGSVGVGIAGTNTNPLAIWQQKSGTNTAVIFFSQPGGSSVGSITVGTTSTAYVTSSDYRLKTAVEYDWDATTRLKQLKPARFEWIANGDDAVPVDGFLAHEVQDVVPEAISGTKDAMRDEEYEVTPAVLDDDGNEVTPVVMGTRSVPDYQGIDQSKLVPLLVKTIQELEARITALEA